MVADGLAATVAHGPARGDSSHFLGVVTAEDGWNVVPPRAHGNQRERMRATVAIRQKRGLGMASAFSALCDDEINPLAPTSISGRLIASIAPTSLSPTQVVSSASTSLSSIQVASIASTSLSATQAASPPTLASPASAAPETARK